MEMQASTPAPAQGDKRFIPIHDQIPNLSPYAKVIPISERVFAAQPVESGPITFWDLEKGGTSTWENKNGCRYLNRWGDKAYFGANGSWSGSLFELGLEELKEPESRPYIRNTIRKVCPLTDGRTVTLTDKHVRYWGSDQQLQQEIVTGSQFVGGGETANELVYLWEHAEKGEQLRACSIRPQGPNEIMPKPYHTAPADSRYLFAESAILSLTTNEQKEVVCEALVSQENGELKPLWKTVVLKEESVPMSSSMGSLLITPSTLVWAGENQEAYAFRTVEGERGRVFTLRKSDGELAELPYAATELFSPTLVGERIVAIRKGATGCEIGELTDPPPVPPPGPGRKVALAIALMIAAYTLFRLTRRAPALPKPTPTVPLPDLSAPPGQWYVFPSTRPGFGFPATHVMNRAWY
ncbi:MAG: hypothetical protein AB7F31_01855 [Parachlamydiales bacterium]